MRSQFEKQLNTLNKSLLEMASMIENAIERASLALKNQDVMLAKEVIESDDEIDNKEKDVESICLKILLCEQPVARDLLMVSTALKMITDMERIGDHAADISEITVYLSKEPYIKKLEHIPQMADATIKMVKDSIDAYVKKDLKLANDVISHDDIVDDLFLKIKEELVEIIHENPENGKQGLDLLMIAKYFERIGDHAVNIAEWIVFSLTGKHKDTQIL